MTPREQAGELIHLARGVLVPCFDGTVAPDWLRRWVGESLGGVCLFARNITSDDQVRLLTDSLRAERSDVVVAIDEEAGDVTRMDARTGSIYPGNAALGRVDDEAVTRDVGRRIGRRLAAAGITLNFAPCADVGSDPANPVIGTRAFGADAELVARQTAAFISGHQAAGVGATAKHFPGHGDTDTDTHHQTAVLGGDLERLSSQALLPFAAAVDAGVASVMAGHLLVPAVDQRPATVSPRWLTEILRKDMGFTGVISTDALEMKAIAGARGVDGIAEGAVLALIAGADLLCLGGSTLAVAELDRVVGEVVDAVRSGRLPEQRLAEAADRMRRLAISPTDPVSTASATPARSVDPAESAVVWQPDAPIRVAAPDLAVARRALQVAGPLPGWTSPVLVVRCVDRPNIAVGDIPWGPAAVADIGGAGCSADEVAVTELLVSPTSPPWPEEPILAAGTVLLVTRDRHRHPWMQLLVSRLRSVRADTILLEMGNGGVHPSDAPSVASFGATIANSLAALGVLRSTGTDGRTQ